MPADGAEGVLVIVDGGRDVVVGRIVAPRCDLALVEALARVRLEARRQGHVIGLREVRPDLAELIELVGLGDLLLSGVEVGGEAAGGEQLGEQEVVDGADPAP